MKAPAVYASVPRLWPNSTVVCLGNGPSLTQEDVEACRGQHVIAINRGHEIAPWADVLYSSDQVWWNKHPFVQFAGLKFGMEHQPHEGLAGFKPNDFGLLRNGGDLGLCLSPDGLVTIRNSGGAAINLAVHLGATRILLLGYDMQVGANRRSNWHPSDTRITHPYQMFRSLFPTMVAPLKKAGVTVINCSRETALTVFPRMPIEQALQIEVAA